MIRIMLQHHQTRDDANATQQPNVEENHNSRHKRRRSNSTSTDIEDDICQEKNRKSKSYKSVNYTTHDNNSNENDKISVCADELDDDNISELIDNGKTETNASSTDDTLQQLAEIFDDSESTRNDIKPHLATIVEKRRQKKFALDKLKSIQDKSKKPANCPSVCSITVNPEIWAKLPFYQQRAD